MKAERGGSAAKGTLARLWGGAVEQGICVEPPAASARAVDGSSFAPCPVCGVSVAILSMSTHLDTNCVGADPPPTAEQKRRKTEGEENAPTLAGEGSQKATALRWRTDLPGRKYGQNTGKAAPNARLPLLAHVLQLPELPGHALVLDLLTEAEEEALVAFIDGPQSPPWHESRHNGIHRGKYWGVVMNLAERTVHEPQVPFPQFLAIVVERIRAAIPYLADFNPNHVNAIWYDRGRGDWLKAHVDDRSLSGDCIVNVSLVGACTMTYAPIKGAKTAALAAEVKVRLPRRCLQVQSGDARYYWTHAIAREDLEEPRRVSLTFRENKLRG